MTREQPLTQRTAIQKPRIHLLGSSGHERSGGGPNQKWVGYITYIPTKEGRLYLAAVPDIYSRKVVGWAMDKNMEQELVASAIVGDGAGRALERRNRDDAGQRLDEVRVHAGAVEAEPAVVKLLERLGHCAPRQIVLLQAELELHRLSSRNSRHKSATSSPRPRQNVPPVLVPSP